MTSQKTNENPNEHLQNSSNYRNDGADIPPMQAVSRVEKNLPVRTESVELGGAELPPMQPVAKIPPPPVKNPPDSGPKGSEGEQTK